MLAYVITFIGIPGTEKLLTLFKEWCKMEALVRFGRPANC